MRALDERHHSAFSEGCFYAAFYLCLAAIVLFSDQLLVWLQHGAWVPHRMWLLMAWGGWERPPALLWGLGQPMLDRFWSLIGNCPITVMLGIAALALAVLGLICDPARTRPGTWRIAH